MEIYNPYFPTNLDRNRLCLYSLINDHIYRVTNGAHLCLCGAKVVKETSFSHVCFFGSSIIHDLYNITS